MKGKAMAKEPTEKKAPTTTVYAMEDGTGFKGEVYNRGDKMEMTDDEFLAYQERGVCLSKEPIK